ncbi:unnamed protein product [Didymodactylos carnosus]|uniref:Par3/HAL N-terminal domain-containing protein n=1 Tax=Didymodactylos carnosus TaxID=1234261 RepID=A0A8S2DQR1_9BILA|nr:unnamed protein product [Didymodactylos carnosus]CAF3730047.1 unnamed protein product [Didymodactylos carnosus]
MQVYHRKLFYPNVRSRIDIITVIMKVIINFGGTKVVVPCGNGEIAVHQLINIATAKYSKIYGLSSYNLNNSIVHLRLKNGAGLDPDDLICDVADDREELLAIIDSSIVNSNDQQQTINSNGDDNISSSLSSSNLSSSLSEHEKIPTTTITKNNTNEVIVTDADLRILVHVQVE